MRHKGGHDAGRDEQCKEMISRGRFEHSVGALPIGRPQILHRSRPKGIEGDRVKEEVHGCRVAKRACKHGVASATQRVYRSSFQHFT